VGLLLTLVSCLVSARRAPPCFWTVFAAATACILHLPITNIVDFPGSIMWLLFGIAAALTSAPVPAGVRFVDLTNERAAVRPAS
jgi:hypothetical protein